MNIRQEQFAVLEKSMRHAMRAGYAKRLRQEFPTETTGCTDEELAKRINEGCDAAEKLEMFNSGHVYRFLRLQYTVPPTWENTNVEELFLRIFTGHGLDPERRLTFLEKNFSKGR